jgi:hypothetical protein
MPLINIPKTREQEPPPEVMTPIVPDQSMSGPMPSLDMAQPKVVLDPNVQHQRLARFKQIQSMQNPLDQVQALNQDRLMADLNKDVNPYGSENNHPGVFGKILHGLSTITGGPNRRLIEEQGIKKDIENTAKQQSEQELQGAQSKHFNAETPEIAPNASSTRAYQSAQTRHLNDESEGLENPQPTFSIHDTDVGPLFVNNQTGQAQHLSVDGTPVGPKIKLTQSQPIIGEDGKPHTYMLDEKGNKVVDLGEHYERPINVHPGGQDEKNFEYSDKSLNAIAKPLSDLAMRMGRLKDTLAQGTPQADALIAPELLTVMAGGQGSGLRMNEAEIARIVGGRSAWENLKGAMQHWATDPEAARSITPDQQLQIRKLIMAVDNKMQKKLQIINDAQSNLVNMTDVKDMHKLVADTRQKLQSIDTGGDSNIQTFTDNGVNYNIPADQVEEFKKDHPHAR